MVALDKYMQEYQIESVGHVDEITDLKHTFCEGIYMRDMAFKAGWKIIGKKHKCEHVAMLLEGVLDVTTEHGVVRIYAGDYFVSPAGTQRMAIAVTDGRFLNIHHNPTNTRDLLEIERNVVEEFDYIGEIEDNKQKVITD